MNVNEIVAGMKSREVDRRKFARTFLEEFNGSDGFARFVAMEVKSTEAGSMARQRLLVAAMNMMEKADEGDKEMSTAYDIDPARIPVLLKALMKEAGDEGGDPETSDAEPEGRDA